MTYKPDPEVGLAVQKGLIHILERQNIELQAALTAEKERAEYALRNLGITEKARQEETKEYTDGTTATGAAPLPDLSPRQQAKQEAFQHLDDIEAMMGGRNGSSIQLRTLIESLAA